MNKTVIIIGGAKITAAQQMPQPLPGYNFYVKFYPMQGYRNTKCCGVKFLVNSKET